VTAQWALWGKEEPDVGFHLLGWSEGTISPENFSQLLTRYSPGTLESLPQVTISWLRGDQGRDGCVGIAIHEAGRPHAALTRYFCLPFGQLAAGGVSYQAMFAALRQIRLPGGPGQPVPADLDTEARPPHPGGPAMRAATLLLTGRPVCVLGADEAGLTERLGFLDSVASLLPYGLRAELSASTWTSSTFQRHRLRLFFARAPRRGEDYTVRWDETGREPTGDPQADAYLRWLGEDPPRRVRQLAQERRPLSFSRAGDLLGPAGRRPAWWA